MKKSRIIFWSILSAAVLVFAFCVLLLGTDLLTFKFKIKFDANGGTASKTQLVVGRGKTIPLPTATREHYTFEGWFYGEKQWPKNKKVYHNYTLTAHWKSNSYELTYYYDGTQVTESTPYDSALKSPEKRGYKMLWYTSQSADATQIKNVQEALNNGSKLYGRWSLVEYSITYNLNGGEIVGQANPTTYTVETPSFTLFNPTRTGNTFLGWTSNLSSAPQLVVTIEQGSVGDLVFSAIWQTSVVNYYIDGQLIDSQSVITGETIQKPNINGTDHNMSGYSANDWFVDASLSSAATFPHTVMSDISFYSTWTYNIGEGFYPYLSKFNSASASSPIEINSEAEMIAYVEYVQFYNISARNKLKPTYATASTEIIEKAITNSAFPANGTTNYAEGSGYCYVFILPESSTRSEECTKTVPAQDLSIQLSTPYALEAPNTRTEEHKFYVENVKHTLEVSTSNQLVYALEKGLNPVCKSGSAAEKVYNKAKEILRSICSDTMDNKTKAQAIYEWLALNVSYDHYAADNFEDAVYNWHKYDSWFAEGVFFNNKAVCDGYCKAFVILAQIENIPCVRVTGNKHAWNKIQIEGNWFEIDATHADTTISVSGTNYEFLNYSYFLFKSSDRPDYTTTNYQELVCNTAYDYFANAVYGTAPNQFSLLVSSKTQYNKIKNKVSGFSTDKPYYTICIALANNVSESILTDMHTTKNQKIAGHYVYVLFIAK